MADLDRFRKHTRKELAEPRAHSHARPTLRLVLENCVFEDGDIGEPLKHIELEPVEVPLEVPEPEKVPA